VTLIVAVVPAASVPDIGETTTFLVRPGGSRIAQSTLPPEALSVMVPTAGGVTSSVVGLTLSVPVAGGVAGAVVAGADADADGGVRGAAGLADGWLPPAGTTGRVVLRALGVTAASALLVDGSAPVALPPAGGAAW
jgi:hypothetical protein